MAIIATLRTAEDRHTAAANSIASIPLDKLVPWDGNVRKTNATDGLEELIASIAAHGVLQSLVVRKANRGKYAIVAGRRRYLALSALAESGTIMLDAPVPCRIIPGSADATEISLSENVVRAPMHPADQFDAFRELIDSGSTPADIAARFGISEAAVKKCLRLARVSPVVFQAYRNGDLTLQQVQGFAISDDHAAQERVFEGIDPESDDADDIRRALTQDEIPASDKRARFVGVAAYEEAGGAVNRDLFSEDDDGIFLLDSVLLDRLALEKLQSHIESVSAEGWKWVDADAEFDYEARSQYRRRHPEPLPLSEEAAAEQKRLSEEYQKLFDSMKEEENDETSERLDEIEERMSELEDTESAFTPDTLAIAGAVLTIGRDGELEVVRGLVREEDEQDDPSREVSERKPKPPFSASLIENLTSHRSWAISATLMSRPDIALAAVTFAIAVDVFHLFPTETSLQVSAKLLYTREDTKGKEALEEARERWAGRLPKTANGLWDWCLAQEDCDPLLELLAFCAACTVNAVQVKPDHADCPRLMHAKLLANAIGLDMTAWFTPDAANYFSRVGRTQIISDLTEATGKPAKRSWDKLKKSELAILAERETAGKGWLPQPLKA
jgi:ParB family chromosome partitioning protein